MAGGTLRMNCSRMVSSVKPLLRGRRDAAEPGRHRTGRELGSALRGVDQLFLGAAGTPRTGPNWRISRGGSRYQKWCPRGGTFARTEALRAVRVDFSGLVE